MFKLDINLDMKLTEVDGELHVVTALNQVALVVLLDASLPRPADPLFRPQGTSPEDR